MISYGDNKINRNAHISSVELNLALFKGKNSVKLRAFRNHDNWGKTNSLHSKKSSHLMQLKNFKSKNASCTFTHK